MGQLIGGKVFVAPNGRTKVRVFRHGFVAPESEITMEEGALIEEMSSIAFSMPEAKGNPFKAFKLMGWTEEKGSR